MESDGKGEAKLRTFVKLLKDIQMAFSHEELIKIAYIQCMNELFPIWIKEFQLFMYNKDSSSLISAYP